ncbi:cholestenol delta-isomerase [Cladophialophora psammophila CBS 110553]|uniref:Cholestenol delta-isomerase n=1 Tax=Cladophialophora psammophila CBS 110553 TaxID=1182543 RepID=W9X756_9EURO|nr:cholestenol delta-isomerase [Cladophialophora psammophila CBS 110553]EXJ66274.1 cholestenol delta-isomerase [Cladophialophora psammophila CBS 110553]
MDFLKNLMASPPPVPPPEPKVVVTKPIHPYYPTEIEIVNFAANEMSVPELLATFATGCTIILSLTWFLTSSLAPRLRVVDKVIALWFCLCGFIHLFFEGYFAYNHTRMGGLQDLFGQLWKEYSLSDSRYLTSDPFVLCMETITAVFWGPLSFLMVYFIITSHPLRYPLQATVSLGQIYGDVLYYATSMFDHYHKNLTYCRPEPYYFWCYYFLMNFFWIVIPALLLASSLRITAKAFKALDRISHSLQGNSTLTRPKANGHIKHA